MEGKRRGKKVSGEKGEVSGEKGGKKVSGTFPVEERTDGEGSSAGQGE